MLAVPTVARGQSTLTGNVSGTVVDLVGLAVPRTLISLTPAAGGSSQQANTDTEGRFTLDQLLPGSYEIRVEAIGYRPIVGRGLTVGGGDQRTLRFTLTPTDPASATIDTISLAGGASSMARRGGVQFGARELRGLPHRFGDPTSVVALSTAFDAELGAQGLPGDLTLMLVDGVPVYRAPHPTARAELNTSPLLATSLLSDLGAFHNPSEIEWAGGAGGVVTASSRVVAPASGLGLEAAFSGGPGWSSSELDFDAPSLTSFEGQLRGAIALNDEGGQVTVVADALRHQTPLMPRITESLSTALAGVDPTVLDPLGQPGVESLSRYSGLVRLDMPRAGGGRFFFRGSGGHIARDFDGSGPVSIGRAIAPAESAIDYSLAGGIVSEYSTNTTIEFRGGISGSARDFDPAVEAVPPAFLVEQGVALGNLASAAGKSSRTDLVLMPMIHYMPDFGRVKFGATIRASRHTMEHTSASSGDFAFTDASALLGMNGFGTSLTAPEASFSTKEYGLFAQYSNSWPTVSVSIGGRYDFESVPTADAAENTAWVTATGLTNDNTPTGFHQLGARFAVTWDPARTGDTRVTAIAAALDGDLDTRVLHEFLSQDTEARVRRFAGAGVDWPTGTIPGAPTGRPAITLLGPDTRAPRSVAFSTEVAQRVGRGTTLRVGGSMRRTDFLTRRRNLNVPAVGQAVDPYGRAIYGTLAQDGGMVTTTTADARRFASFGPVWALDPDGWSEYRGLTVSLEHSSASLQLFGSYTYSETTDNWRGAASGQIEATSLPGLPGGPGGDTEWSEGTSDYDIPHRAAAGATLSFGRVALSGIYHFRSGLPFTPGYRYGVDANGDGSMRNDVAYVPGDAQLAMLLDEWPCLEDQADSFAERNSCRGSSRHGVDVRLHITLGRLGGRDASVFVDGLNLIEDTGGVVDNALLLVDPAATIMTSGSTVTIPVNVNPDFGQVRYPMSRGRMIRLGVRVGA